MRKGRALSYRASACGGMPQVSALESMISSIEQRPSEATYPGYLLINDVKTVGNSKASSTRDTNAILASSSKWKMPLNTGMWKYVATQLERTKMCLKHVALQAIHKLRNMTDPGAIVHDFFRPSI